MKKIYSGFLRDEDYDENYEGLMLEDDFGDGLFSDILNDCHRHGYFISFKYYISDKEFDLRDLEKHLIESYFGISDIKIESCGCETCGYMCVENATVGGHDIRKELSSYVGKYCVVEIDFYKDKEDMLNEFK